MLPEEHSRTAEVTAAIRAGHLLYDAPLLFEDPFALELTSPLWRTVTRHPLLHRLIVRGLLGPLRPVHGWILVRDHLTEVKLREFVDRGHRQFVLLGAGFDSTALRRPAWLEGVHIIEVDHPATQAVKLARIAGLPPAAQGADFEAVALDFEREGLAEGFARSRYRGEEPAFFAWQGVIYYLTEAAIEQTLTALAALAAPGSELLFDFLLPEHALGNGDGRVLSFARMFTARLGERYTSYHSPADVTALLDRTGFDVVEILLDRELQSTYFEHRCDGLSAMRGFGIAHARRR
ncbi:MAG: class I SAM-dependent methyltransferase [Gammaproteobacteria bacterium]